MTGPTSSQAQLSPLESRIEQIKANFLVKTDWEDRYKLVIEYGKNLKAIPEEFKTETYKVKGCQSQVWLHAELKPDGRLRFMADSDAVIVRGLVALLVGVYSEATPDEVLALRPTFLKDIGFESNLSPSRANGLQAMIKQIYLYATAFKAMGSKS